MLKAFLSFLIFFTFAFATEEAKFVQTEYKKPFRVVYELFLDHPEKLRPALGWISNVIFVLTNPPYNFNLEDIDIVVVSHGRELEVFAKEHKDKGSLSLCGNCAFGNYRNSPLATDGILPFDPHGV
ncbi:hypothetical protein [Thermocrinis jamiesonii]|uniref:hypothetical protein n=1 Tax=Thermocrinis jamiesonii TaxID=1302351 RepID=UPI001E4BCAA9|nr:hypothetical protein [Thermocrinis jamiesonii]